MKITVNTVGDGEKFFRIISKAKRHLVGSKTTIAEMIEVMGITIQKEIVHLKIVMKASKMQVSDKLEIAIAWGIFPNNEPEFRKIIAHATRTVDNFSDMLFQFEIPREEGPTEEVTIAYYIFYAIIRALELQRNFLSISRRLLNEQIEKLNEEAEKQLIWL